VKRCQ